MTRHTFIGTAAAAAAVLAAGAASAHTGHGDAHGFVHGFLHPLGGLDHLLAMVAVGLLAANLGGRATWMVPATFVALMVGGSVLGFRGDGVPFVEAGIALSVVIFGALVAARVRLPVGVAMAVVGSLAVFHGHAHGAEMPADASGALYGLGFVVATASLHAAGVIAGLGFARLASPTHRHARAVGAAIAAVGVVLATGVI